MPDKLPDDLEPLPTKPSWAQDGRAKAEEKNWADEPAIRGQKVTNNVLWLKIYGWILAGITITFSLLFVGSRLAWAAHYLLPISCHWLSADQLTKIQSVLFSGGMGAVLSSIAQKQLASS